MKLDMENCRDDERASKMDGTCFQIKFLSNSLPFPYATKFNLSTLFEAVWQGWGSQMWKEDRGGQEKFS